MEVERTMEVVQSSKSKVLISLCGLVQNFLCQSVFLGQLDETWSLRETGVSSTDRERLTVNLEAPSMGWGRVLHMKERMRGHQNSSPAS